MSIKDLEPKVVWGNFYGLTQVPRPSKHEGKVIEYLLNWGKEHGVEVCKDETGNVIFRVPATPGYENRRGVILQGHMDMVPQKTSDSSHNFLTDPINAYVDGDWVTADRTTLGADNGMGVAMGLAVCEDKSVEHGPVEVLVTYDEETGMTGATALKPGVLKGDILINIALSKEFLSERLVSGTRLDVSVRVRAENDWRISPKAVSTVTNSLFADSSNDVRDASGHVGAAHIACGRHLQNLGELADAGSFGDSSHVRSAEVLNDIDFGRSTASGSWWSTYCSQDGSYFAGRDEGGVARFAPVEPSGLSSFDGKGHVLHGLNIRSDAGAGLFASVGDFTFRDVRLSGTRVVGKGSCGALVAEVAGDVDVDGVRVYLDRAAGDLVGAKVSSPFVSGATSGGLVGSVRPGASLDVLGSFASTIVSGTGCAGGLVGAADGSVHASESYADCYVSGADVSGLVGKAGNSSSVRVDDSYAVGYLYGTSRSSGLVSGRASSAGNSKTRPKRL